jgi:hypothetical protein
MLDTVKGKHMVKQTAYLTTRKQKRAEDEVGGVV